MDRDHQKNLFCFAFACENSLRAKRKMDAAKITAAKKQQKKQDTAIAVTCCMILVLLIMLTISTSISVFTYYYQDFGLCIATLAGCIASILLFLVCMAVLSVEYFCCGNTCKEQHHHVKMEETNEEQQRSKPTNKRKASTYQP